MTNAIDRLTTPQVPIPAHLGQATAIEQSRAVAEVQAAVVAAKQMPRDTDRAQADMRRSCGEPALASRAFFSFPRSGEAVSGPSIHLARELARCWGNIQYGIAELRRDDAAGISEMQAFAWDVETNTRSASIFIVPHRKDTKRGVKDITDLRDIYENNANQGARRVREAIFAVLPQWFTEEAQELCRKTLTSASGRDLEQRIATAVEQFGRMDITQQQLEEKVGQPRALWNGEDVADLGVLFQSLKRREITRDEAFPPAMVTAADITGEKRAEVPA
ncbi:hypothetical protein [Micromonospora sp. NPDC023956]|uniref:hypothetical protein n=1 Tax=Micromonospora sp. NPDC023956 TaxID=3155722 RepID=UPI0033E1129E